VGREARGRRGVERAQAWIRGAGRATVARPALDRSLAREASAMRWLGEDHGAEPPDAFPTPRTANAAAEPRDAVAFGAYDHLVAASWRPSIDPA